MEKITMSATAATKRRRQNRNEDYAKLVIAGTDKKRKATKEPQRHRKVFALVSDGQMCSSDAGTVLTYMGAKPSDAARSAFNATTRNPSKRAKLKQEFQRSKNGKLKFDTAAAVPPALEEHLEEQRELFKRNVELGLSKPLQQQSLLRIVKALPCWKSENGAGAKLTLKNALSAWDNRAEVYRTRFWKTLDTEEDDRFLYNVTVVIQLMPLLEIDDDAAGGAGGAGGDHHHMQQRSAKTYMCMYRRNVKPRALEVLRLITHTAVIRLIPQAVANLLFGACGDDAKDVDEKRIKEAKSKLKAIQATLKSFRIPEEKFARK